MKTKAIRIFTLILGVFLVISLVRSIADLWQKGSLFEKEEQRFAKARLDHEQLLSEYDKIQSPQYVEQQARDKLGLTKEGEVVVVLPQKPEAKPPNIIDAKVELSSLPIWRQWIEVILN
ncbi:septum formation initiator family protein [Candidatus Gottesmanbacteria bacterium]|nr:septum formation initiator family protein [Candidatus Gottesmanbacteria bacterium]